MTKYTSRIFIICLLLFLVTAAQPALGSDWTQFQKDNYNTGVTEDRSPVTDPATCSLSWEYKLGGNVDSTPIVAEDMMYVLAGNNHIYAFNRTTGGLIWEKSTSGGTGGFVVGSATIGNEIIFVPTTDGKIFAFDAKTGNSKWNITVSSKQIDTPIIYSDGKIYFGEAIGGHKYYCYDENGNEVWSRTATTSISGEGSYYWTGAAVIGNSLVYGDDDGHIVSVNKDTGTDIAEINVSEEFGVECKGIRSSILYVEEVERVYFTSTGGYCFSLGFNPADGTFNTSDKYSEKIAYSTSTPAYYNGRVYVGTGSVMAGAGKGVYCLDANLTGVIWNYPAGAVQSSPAISTCCDDGDGEVYIYFTVNNATGGVYCLKDFTDCTSPELAWSYKNSSKTYYSLQGVAISDGWIYFGSDKKYVFGLTTPSPILPTAAFSVSAEEGAVPFTVKFTDNSENATSWAWDFDNDGNVDSNEQNPLHTYYTEGNYTVKLTASNENGSDIKEIPGMITVGPELSATPEDAWYQFHKDAQHNGYTESDAPDSANVAWTAKPRDDAYSLVPSSSVAIAEEKVFGLCNGPTDDWGNPLTSYGQLVAFDESTGEEIWNVTVSAPEWGSWSSPAYDSGKVFASAGKETYCANASTGDIVWTFHNPSDLASCNGGPAIGDGKVFFSDWDGGNYYCLDENTGVLLWTFKVDGTYAQATPSYKDGKVYFSSWTSVNAVYCVNATTGELIWKNDELTNNPCGSITVTDEGLYVTVYSFGSSDGIYKLDLTDGHVLWGRSDISPSDSTPTVTGGKVYLSTGCYGYSDPKTYCLDASDGHTIWETDASDKMGDWICSVAVADGKVFTGGAGEGLFSGCGELYVLDATTGAKVWNYTGCGCSPAVADSMVFSIGGGKLYAFKEPEVIPPEAKFSSNVSSGDAPLTVSFTDESTGEGITWVWDFENDGTVNSIEQNPVYTYATAGSYTVNLTVTNTGGSDSEVKTGYIVVSEPVPEPPVSDFAATPTSGDAPLTVNFTDLSTGDAINAWAWDFDSDGNVDSTDQSPVYTYATAGSYTVNLTVTNTGGSDSEVKVGYIVVSEPLPAPPVAAFSAEPTSGYSPLTVNFTDQSNGTVSFYTWDFDNDGVVDSTDQNPVHTYTTSGTYAVNLTVTNAGGSDSEVKGGYIVVNEPIPESPIANFSANITIGDAPLEVQFTDASIGTVSSYAWDFNNDGTVDSEEQSPSHTYNTAGTYAVNLTVTNAGGSDSEVKTEYIFVSEPLPELPVAAFTATPASGDAPLTVNFTDQSTGVVSSYSWDFDNDGTAESNEQNPSYTYVTAGTYTVKLTVTNARGNDDEVKTGYIMVSKPLPEPPIADFSANVTIGDAPLEVKFTDASAGTVSSYAWDFNNDGEVDSTDQTPVYTYETAGTYTVKLIVTNAGGSDDEVKAGYIVVSEPLPAPPVAAFSAAPTSGDTPLTVQFADMSTGIVSSYAWDFNNDENIDSTEQSPSCTYDVSGNYTVKLTVTGPGGSDSEIKAEYIVVSDSLPASPVANFTATPTSGDAPLTVNFTDLSTGDAINAWAWDFDSDGNVDSTDQNPSCTYTVPGVYSVRLNVSNAAGSDDEVKVGFIEVSRSLAKTYSTAMNNTNSGAPDPAIPGFVGPAGDGKVTTGNAVNPVFKGWASTIVDYSPANQSNGYTNATKALGPVTGSNMDIVSLGDLTSIQINAGEKPGSITLGFNVPIANGDGPDLALFENSFMSGSQVFAELGYVEVSTDNITYVRFPAVSLTPGLVGAYGTIDPTNVTNLVGKHVNAYGNSWGTPFDLSYLENMTEVLNGSVDLNNINYVRVVDIPGNGTFRDSLGNSIYDAWVTWGSGGVDLEAVGVLNTAYLPLPVAEFSVNVTSGDSPLSVQFTDESTGSPTSWSWDFNNDGTVDSTEQTPSYTYDTAGTYTVNLTVGNAGGSDSEVKTDYISVSEPSTPTEPVAAFTADVTSGTAPLTVNFIDQSTGTPTSWLWEFGDGASAAEQNASHTYASAGIYTVTLTVASAGGSDSEIKTDYIAVSTPETPDTTKPVIESVVLFPANTTAGSTISISVNATDDVEVTEVKAGDVPLTKTDSLWKGSITAPSSLGDYSLQITMKDAAGNTAEISVPYRVVQLSGGANIAVSPRSSSVAAGNTVSLSIKVKNTQNIDDTFKVRISVSDLPASYQADLSWFNWTEKVVTLKAGEEILVPMEVTVPDGTAAGRKLFRTNVNSEASSITGFDTGYLVIS